MAEFGAIGARANRGATALRAPRDRASWNATALLAAFLCALLSGLAALAQAQTPLPCAAGTTAKVFPFKAPGLDPNNPSPITSYTLYVGQAKGGPYASPVSFPAPTTADPNGLFSTPTVCISLLAPQYFVLTASNAFGESIDSNEVLEALGKPPGAPTLLQALQKLVSALQDLATAVAAQGGTP